MKAKNYFKPVNGHGAVRSDALPADWPAFVAALATKYPLSTANIPAMKSFTTWKQAEGTMRPARDEYSQWRKTQK